MFTLVIMQKKPTICSYIGFTIIFDKQLSFVVQSRYEKKGVNLELIATETIPLAYYLEKT